MGTAAIMGSMRSFMQDASAVKQQVKPGSAKRVLRFAAPCAGLLAVFLSVVILGAGIGIVKLIEQWRCGPYRKYVPVMLFCQVMKNIW